MAYSRWSLKTRALAKGAVIGLLDGIGSGNAKRVRSEFVLHARRRLSDAEIAAQTPEWCAIRAIHSAGGGIPW